MYTQKTARRHLCSPTPIHLVLQLILSYAFLPGCRPAVAVLARKAHTTGTPTYLSQHLHQRIATYSTRSSSLPLLTVLNPSTVFARRAFNYTAPTTWNSLPADILTCDSESGFKRLLKTHLLNNVTVL